MAERHKNSTSHAAKAANTVDIGSRRELFVDDHLIDKLHGTSLRLHQPQPAEVAIQYDKPWEDRLAFYAIVLKDDDTYRMYYRGSHIGSGQNPTCYAESTDGIHWTKPDLGLVGINASTENNVILPHNGQFCAFVDTRPGVPEAERYKANARDPLRPHSLITYVSADGIHWKKLRDKPTVPMALENNFDSQNVISGQKLRTATCCTPVTWWAEIASDPRHERRQQIFSTGQNRPR